MYIKTAAIVLQQIPYSDSRFILKMLTREYGIQTYLVHGSKGKKNNKSAYCQPMQLLEIVATSHTNRNFQHIKEISLLYVYRSLSVQPYKSSIAMFVNEILIKTSPDAGHAEQIFDFVYEWLIELDHTSQPLTYHAIKFLLDFTVYLGIDPMNNFGEQHCLFCIRDGKFVKQGEILELHLLFTEEQSRWLYALMSEDKICLTRQQRIECLDAFIRYYQYHVPGFNECKTAGVLHQVFDA